MLKVAASLFLSFYCLMGAKASELPIHERDPVLSVNGYALCAGPHFYNLGLRATLPFEEFADSSKAVCSSHLKRIRKRLSDLGYGAVEQERVVEQIHAENLQDFRRSYEKAQKSELDKVAKIAEASLMELVVRQALDAWDSCLDQRAVEFAGFSPEPITTVVTASFGACHPQQQSYEAAVRKMLNRDMSNAAIEKAKSLRSEALSAKAMVARSRKAD